METPEPNPFSREAILERTGVEPACKECATDKTFYRSGSWMEHCPTCNRITNWGARMPGTGSWDFKGKYEKPK